MITESCSNASSITAALSLEYGKSLDSLNSPVTLGNQCDNSSEWPDLTLLIKRHKDHRPEELNLLLGALPVQVIA